jgi:integrase
MVDGLLFAGFRLRQSDSQLKPPPPSISRLNFPVHQNRAYLVAAYEAWIAASGLTEGPVLRSIDRWGHISDEVLRAGSFVPLLRALFRTAGVPAPDSYSSHSLRRGFATWANSNQWDLKMLMEYVGWKDVRSAMRYIDAADPFAQHRIESALTAAPMPVSQQLAVAAPAKPSP